MKVTLIYEVYCGGPIRGRKVYDEWPWTTVPRVRDSIFLADLNDPDSGQMIYVERLIWNADDGSVEIYDSMPGIGVAAGSRSEAIQEAAAKRLGQMRAVGFNFPLQHWESH